MKTVLESELVCPECGHKSREIMPTDSCLYSYECKGCGELLKPKAGDCCVFCS
ncbi:GDCCVxC domain-containing (seleno)protein [Vibrio vulnificus]|uniref:GDCCVxC domain-containing (seleno)protein n=1 Tax=Vibrio vulnificus TaxID=672 RepID=UPI003D9A5E89